MDTAMEDSPVQRIEARYPPSWIDRLILWIDRFPGSAWLFYLVSILTLTFLTIVVLWIDGSVPFGSYGLIQGIFPPFVFYGLALYHHLTRVGSRSLQTFRPLLQVDEAEIARLDYELATLPRAVGWLTIVIGIACMPAVYLSGQVFGDQNPNTALPHILAILSGAFFNATVFCLVIRIIRQLRLVPKLLAKAKKISLLKLEPAHAFSRLTARTGIGLMLFLILGYIYNAPAFYGGWLVVGYVVFLAPAVVIFVVPVMGLRDRLMEQKRHELHETSDLLQLASDKLETKIRTGDYTDLQGMETAIQALIRKREMLGKISTWPWDPATLRGFASTLLLPILIWLVTRLLERLL